MSLGTAVVTGANSGIGYAFAQTLLKDGWRVIAIDRNIGEKITSLDCVHAQVDVSSPSSISSFQQHFFSNEAPIDLLLHIAGVMAAPIDDTLETTSLDTLEKTFAVNAFGPLLLTKALLPNILASKATTRRVAVMSSRVGSIADNSSGGGYAYRSSKSAVNQIFKNLSIDLKERGIVVLMMHPGFVYSNLLADRSSIPPEAVQPEEAATKLWQVLQGPGSAMENTGTFWHREGFQLPW